nr:MAG TPA: hypothetical protein [Caudoviricetes sp.]
MYTLSRDYRQIHIKMYIQERYVNCLYNRQKFQYYVRHLS